MVESPRSHLDRVKGFFRGLSSSEKSDPTEPKPRRGTAAKGAAEAPKKSRSLLTEGRESMEAVVVAFILAFLFRTFEAEAFVIPTGSMAPTLLGRNKESVCPQCKQLVVVGASDEIDQGSGRLKSHERVETAFCPNCRFEVPMRQAPVFTGDRILVTKFPYELAAPNRWDVIVFKYPQDPQTNYIKRLVGLPGEEIQLRQGDVYVQQSTNGPLEILRKGDPNKQRVLQILVYDNDHPEHNLHKHGWPERWAAVKQTRETQETSTDATRPGEVIAGWEEDQAGWTLDAEERAFQLDAARTSEGEPSWLRYRHVVPESEDWQAWAKAELRGGQAELTPWKRLQLITDFCGYNAFTGREPDPHQGEGLFWVGDLTLNCRIEVLDGEAGEILLELNEGSRRYRCRFDLATGEARLFHPDDLSRDADEITELATAQTEVRGQGTYDVSFANVDNRLCLWVNDELIDFGTDEQGRPGGEYNPFGGLAVRQAPNDRDLIPVGIAAQGADVRVSRLKLERDIYYRGESLNENEYRDSAAILRGLRSDPAAWYAEYSDPESGSLAVRFDRLGPDEFFALGDNSPRSKDSRLWSDNQPGELTRQLGPDEDYLLPHFVAQERGVEFSPRQLAGEAWRIRRVERGHAIPRRALVGKAFYVYWPHGKPFLNNGEGFALFHHKDLNGEKTDYPSVRVPFYPDFSRMKRIR